MVSAADANNALFLIFVNFVIPLFLVIALVRKDMNFM